MSDKLSTPDRSPIHFHNARQCCRTDSNHVPEDSMSCIEPKTVGHSGALVSVGEKELEKSRLTPIRKSVYTSSDDSNARIFFLILHFTHLIESFVQTCIPPFVAKLENQPLLGSSFSISTTKSNLGLPIGPQLDRTRASV